MKFVSILALFFLFPFSSVVAETLLVCGKRTYSVSSGTFCNYSTRPGETILTTATYRDSDDTGGGHATVWHTGAITNGGWPAGKKDIYPGQTYVFKRFIWSTQAGPSAINFNIIGFAEYPPDYLDLTVQTDRSNLRTLSPYIDSETGMIWSPVQVTTVTQFNPGTPNISHKLLVLNDKEYKFSLDNLLGKNDGYRLLCYVRLEERKPLPRNTAISLQAHVNPESISAELTVDDNYSLWNSNYENEDFFVEKIPDILGLAGFWTAGGYLNIWMNAGVGIKNSAISSFDWNLPFLHATSTSWLLLTPRIKEVFDRFIQPTESGFLTQGVKDQIAAIARQQFKRRPIGATSAPLSTEWGTTTNIRYYHEQHVTNRQVTGYALDDVGASFGRFSFYLVPIGTVSLTADGSRYFIKFKYITIHVLDSYDFNDMSFSVTSPSTWTSQALGCYREPNIVGSPGTFYGRTCVSNSSFNWYRRMKARGGDYNVFTTPIIVTLPQSVAFYAAL